MGHPSSGRWCFKRFRQSELRAAAFDGADQLHARQFEFQQPLIDRAELLHRKVAVVDVARIAVSAQPGQGVERRGEVPEGAVVVPGSRPASGDFARERGLQLSAPMIVKYRDAKTDKLSGPRRVGDATRRNVGRYMAHAGVD